MVVSNVGKNRIRDLIAEDISSGKMGIGTTSPLASDTDLENEVADTYASVTVNKGERSLSVSHLINSLQGNSNQLSELAIYMNADSEMLDRFVFPPVNKTNTLEISTTVTYKVV